MNYHYLNDKTRKQFPQTKLIPLALCRELFETQQISDFNLSLLQTPIKDFIQSKELIDQALSC